MTALWARELEESVRPQTLWLALWGLRDQSASPRHSSQRHNAAVLRSIHGPGSLVELTDRLDGADTAPKRLHRGRMREPQRSEFCPVILPRAPYAPRLEQRQSEAWESRESAGEAPITTKVPSNGWLAP